MNTLHVKRGDTVEVISGKNKGKRGKVIETSPSERKIIVEGVKMVSKHLKPRGQQAGGIIQTPAPFYACKAMVVCPKCDKATRVGHVDKDGKKFRVCKKCGQTF